MSHFEENNEGIAKATSTFIRAAVSPTQIMSSVVSTLDPEKTSTFDPAEAAPKAAPGATL